MHTPLANIGYAVSMVIFQA